MKQATCVLLVWMLPLLSGCGGGSEKVEKAAEAERSREAGKAEKVQKTADGEELEILCGSSFRPPMERLVEMYHGETGRRPMMSFGGSEDHLPHVKTKAAGDVYVSHTPYMQYTKEAGALQREIAVGFLAPVLVVSKKCDKQVRSIADLAQPDLIVVLPDPQFSTCGQMVDKLLEEDGLKESVSKNVDALMKHHSEIGNHLKLGSAQAGIMWNGVAHTFRDGLDVVPAPYKYKDEIRVAVMGLSYSSKQEELKEFLDFVEKHGKEVFSEFGYVKEVEANSGQ